MVNCVLSHRYWMSFWPGVKEIKHTFLHTEFKTSVEFYFGKSSFNINYETKNGQSRKNTVLGGECLGSCIF